MTGVAWSYEDPGAAAKVIEKFHKDEGDKVKTLKDTLKAKTGMLSGELISAADLAKVPGLKETQAMLVALMQEPGVSMYQSLLTPGLMIVALLEAHVKNLEAKGETA